MIKNKRTQHKKTQHKKTQHKKTQHKDNYYIRKKNYDELTIYVFEIISAFVSDLYYNMFYTHAIDEYNINKSISIKDHYMNNIQKFIQSFNKKNHYINFRISLKKYYIKLCSNDILNNDFIDILAKSFISNKSLFESLTYENKDKLIRICLLESIKQFSLDLFSNKIINSIIITRKNENIRPIQNMLICCLLDQRDYRNIKVFKSKNNKNYSDYMKTIKDLRLKNNELRNKYIKQKNVLKKLLTHTKTCMKNIEDNENIINDLKMNNTKLTSIINNLSAVNNNTNNNTNNDSPPMPTLYSSNDSPPMSTLYSSNDSTSPHNDSPPMSTLYSSNDSTSPHNDSPPMPTLYSSNDSSTDSKSYKTLSHDTSMFAYTNTPTASPTITPTASPTITPTASPTITPTTSNTVSDMGGYDTLEMNDMFEY
jgi:hypothetical protein